MRTRARAALGLARSLLLLLAVVVTFVPLAHAQQTTDGNGNGTSVYPPVGLAAWWSPASWLPDAPGALLNESTGATSSAAATPGPRLQLALDSSAQTAAGSALADSAFVGVPVTNFGFVAPMLVNATGTRPAVRFDGGGAHASGGGTASTLQLQSQGRARTLAWHASDVFLALSLNASCAAAGGCVLLAHRALDAASASGLSSLQQPSLTLYIDSAARLIATLRYPLLEANETYASADELSPGVRAQPMQESTLQLPQALPPDSPIVLRLSLSTSLPPRPFVRTVTTARNVTRDVFVTTPDGGTERQQRVETVFTTVQETVPTAQPLQTSVALEAYMRDPQSADADVTSVLHVSQTLQLPAGADLRALAQASSSSFVGGFGVPPLRDSSQHALFDVLRPLACELLELQVYVATPQSSVFGASPDTEAEAASALSPADAQAVGETLVSVWLQSAARPAVTPPPDTSSARTVLSPAPEQLLLNATLVGVRHVDAPGLAYLPRSQSEVLRATLQFTTLNVTDNAAIAVLMDDLRAVLGFEPNSTALVYVGSDGATRQVTIDFVRAVDAPPLVNTPYRAVMRLADLLDSGEAYRNPLYESLSQVSRTADRLAFEPRDPYDDSSDDTAELRRKLLIGLLVPAIFLILTLLLAAFILYWRNGELRVALQKRILEFTRPAEPEVMPPVGTAGLEADPVRRFQLEGLQLHRCKGCKLLQCADTVPLATADPLEVSKANIDVGEVRRRRRADLMALDTERSMIGLASHSALSLKLDMPGGLASAQSSGANTAAITPMARYAHGPGGSQYSPSTGGRHGDRSLGIGIDEHAPVALGSIELLAIASPSAPADADTDAHVDASASDSSFGRVLGVGAFPPSQVALAPLDLTSASGIVPVVKFHIEGSQSDSRSE